MKTSIRYSGVAIAILAVGLISTIGCKKSEGDKPAAEAASAEASAESKPKGQEAAAAGEGDLAFTSADQGMAQADEAIKEDNYVLAADTLMKMNFSGMIETEKQSWEYNKRMATLQTSLADAAANGDAKAQAAIERLKASRRVR